MDLPPSPGTPQSAGNVDSAGETTGAAQTRDAIAALFETHFDRVARYIYLRIGSSADAEDLASDVFVRAVRSADSFVDTGAPLEAWIFRIARNISVDYLRQKSRRPIPLPIEDAAPMPDPGDGPEAPIELMEDLQMLHEAIGQLTEAQQEVLALRFSDAEMNSTEIAEALGRSAGSVREMQSAAIKRLRQILEPRRQDHQAR